MYTLKSVSEECRAPLVRMEDSDFTSDLESYRTVQLLTGDVFSRHLNLGSARSRNSKKTLYHEEIDPRS